MQIDHAALAQRFATAYEQHAEEVFRFCRAKSESTQEAEDFMQDTFLRTWEYLRAGNSIEDLRTFLFKVASNLVIDERRKKKSVSLNDLQDQGFDPSIETIAKIEQSIDVTTILLSAEKKHEYKLLVMRYVEGLRPADIAQQTGLAPNTVAVRLHRAVQKITEKLSRKNKVLAKR